MADKWMTKGDCIIHPSAKAAVKIDGYEICYECWNKATSESREKIKEAIGMYLRGLLTPSDLQGCFAEIIIEDSSITASQEPD